ncbi:carboxypeptidase regulatory-like domain-containing protein [bacterium]|nr:carboxypeptidase regulatory-like domain-containing protein [bacterium]
MLRVMTALLFLTPATALAADGAVTGRVIPEGKPLASGKVTFHLDDGEFVGSVVKDGRYAVSRVPSGTRRVTIEGPGVPGRYSLDTSPLTVEVKGRSAEFDFHLTK